jgi:uncharacterized membrane protein
VSDEDEQPTNRRSDASQPDRPADNSLGRLLTLSDGIFAISMTLLALDLQVPDLGSHPSDASLRHALAANNASYLSFLLTFYVVAGYWRQHRRLLRSVVTTHPALIRDTLALLLFVAAMPFPASLLGRYGSEPISLAIYGSVNALATLSLIVTSADVRRLELADRNASVTDDYVPGHRGWISFVVFVLAIPAGYVVGDKGPYVLLLLLVPEAVSWVRRITHHR